MLSLAFFLSGLSALVYQVVWQRLLALHSGVGIYSIALIVAAFMAGLGLGSLLGGRLSLRLEPAAARRAFAGLELGIAAFGAFSPWLYHDVLYGPAGGGPLLLTGLRHFAALLPPTVLMGMSLPFLARAVVLEASVAGRLLGRLYAWNMLGASLGALLAPWVLMRFLGLGGAARVAAGANLVAALAALWPSAAAARADEASADAPPPPPRDGLRVWLPLYALSGFCALALEILWFRLVDVTVKATAFTFGTVLCLYLLGSALGSLWGARRAERLGPPVTAFLAIQCLLLMLSGAAVALLARLPPGLPVYRALFEYWGGGPFRLGDDFALGPLLLLYGLLPALLYGVPTFLMGLSFPLAQRGAQDEARTSGWKAGLLQSANILGCVAGSLLAGLWGLERLGTIGTLRALLLLGLVFALLGWRRGPRPLFAGAALGLLAVAAALPANAELWTRLHGVAAALVEEDATGVAALTSHRPGSWEVWTNGHSHSGLPFGGVHTILGALPTAVHPAPLDVAVVGLGSGDSAWAAGWRTETRRVEVFELCGAQRVLLERLEAREAVPKLGGFLRDPRVLLRVADGRQALAARPGAFDVVQIDALWPYYAFSGHVYSQEFFELAGRSLKPGGIFCSWAPTPRVRATFARAFPHVLAARHGQILLGSLTPIGGNARERLERLAGAREYLGATRLNLVYSQLKDVAPLEAGDAATWAGLMPNRDLFPRDELASDGSWTFR